jgi:hypothetical protein
VRIREALRSGTRCVALAMERQQRAVAEGANEIEILCPCFGVALANPADIAILAARRTESQPSGEIRNVSVDGYCHAFIIQLRDGGVPRGLASVSIRGDPSHML